MEATGVAGKDYNCDVIACGRVLHVIDGALILLITVNQSWFDTMRNYAGFVQSSAQDYLQLVDDYVDPKIADREGILAQFAPMLLFLWRLHFELTKASQTTLAAVDLLASGSTQPIDFDRMVDELSLRQRKLLESLLAVILLAQHPEPVYFKHFNLKHQLKELNRQAQNLQSFYGRPSPAIAQRITNTQGQITDTETDPGFAIANCSYLNQAGDFKTTEQMFFDSLQFSSEFEKAATGFSYQAVFGRVSKDVHFSEGTHRIAKPDEQRVAAAIEQLQALGLCIILRVNSMHQAIGTNIAGANAQIETLFRNHIPHAAAAALAGSAATGDLVLVIEDPINRVGEIAGVVTSNRTNYVAYEVNILFGANLGVELIPSTQLSVLVPHARKAGFVQNALNSGTVDQSMIAGQSVNEQIMTIFAAGQRGNEAFIQALEENNLEASLFAQ